MKTRTKWALGVVVIVGLGVLAAGSLAWVLRGRAESYELFTDTVTRGAVRHTVVSTGKLEAMVRVDVGSQVTGQVQELYASFNSTVHEGQVLAQLDPRNFQAQVRNAEANLSAARSRIETSRADRLNAEANLASAQANLASSRKELELAETNLERSEGLHADGLISDSELENVSIQLESARARLAQQEASLQQAEVQITSRDAAIVQAEASLEQAEADLEEAQLNLGYTTIRSPVDGVVISREVDVGQTVSASTSAPTLFVIANDLTRMQLQANIDEADIGLLGQDKRVDFSVDAYPEESFVGRIQEIRLNSSTTQNVVTYEVIITFGNPELKLKPGMTAYLTITVAEREDVLRVPNAALRYDPPEALLARLAVGDGPLRQTARAGAAPAESEMASPIETTIPGDPVGSDPTTDRRGAEAPAAPEEVFMPGQLWNTADMLRFQGAPPSPPRTASVWVMTGRDLPERREVMAGISDGSMTEVVSGDLSEGEIVVVSDSLRREEEEENANTGQRMFTIRGGR